MEVFIQLVDLFIRCVQAVMDALYPYLQWFICAVIIGFLAIIAFALSIGIEAIKGEKPLQGIRMKLKRTKRRSER